MTDTPTSPAPSTADSASTAAKSVESDGHFDHLKEAVKDAAEKIVARVEHERSEHEHAAHDGRVHHAREAIQEAIDKATAKLPGAKK